MFKKEKAIVIGGGISGKLAARVLSDHFKEVIIIEQDQEPVGPIPRKGVRQGNHLHALLLGGQAGMEELFPGITESFYASGAVKINSTKDLAWFHHGVWKLRFEGGYSTTLQTRPHLEWHIEQYIKKIRNITVHYGQAVKGYLYNPENNRIYGVELKEVESFPKTLTADLIVDASGSGSFTADWLDKIGVRVPAEKVEIGLSYVSQLFQLQDRNSRDWQIKIIYPNPPHEKIGGTISRVEGDRYLVTLNGYQGEIKEKEVLQNEHGFLELAKKLPRLDIYVEIKDGIPLSKTAVYRIPHIIWKRFDKVRRLPDGLLLMGDSICRIDPVFGQGMSLAVLEALVLQKLLMRKKLSLQKMIHTFNKKAAKTIFPIWNMVLTEDFRYPGIPGKKPAGLQIQQWYAKNIFLLSSQNEKIYDSLINVINLIKPSTALLHPQIIKKVVTKAIFKK